MNKSNILLFTDGSVNAQTNIGYGAYLAVEEPKDTMNSLAVKVKRFEHTSSAKLELQTLLWALGDFQVFGSKITVYTDSQNIVGLRGRRTGLEQNNYHSKNDKLLKNHGLYRAFYEVTDQLDCEFVKVNGHLVSNQKDNIDKLFTLVDKASRKALRKDQQK